MQIKFTKRYSHGLDFTAAYSFQKELTVGAETFDPAFAPVNPAINNLDNLRSNKVISGLSMPHRLAIGANYTTPKLKTFAPLSYGMRDWTFGAYLVYNSGRPIQAPAAQAQPGEAPLASLLSLCAPMTVLGACKGYQGASSFANRVPGQPLYLTDLNSSFDPFQTFTLNPAAWSQPAAGQFGTGSAYYNDYRYRRQETENLSLARIFRLREGMNLSIRIELMNAFNRVLIPNPSAGNALETQRRYADGRTQSGFGYVNAINTGGQRTGQLVARFNL
jgi:hypothetical protein